MNIRNRCRSFRFQENDNIRKMSLNVLFFIINQLRYRYIKKNLLLCLYVMKSEENSRTLDVYCIYRDYLLMS